MISDLPMSNASLVRASEQVDWVCDNSASISRDSLLQC
jgi:hypothetical protein